MGIFLILIGTFMESLAQIILFTPVFLPLVTQLGIDPITFGIFTVLTCEIGFLTPPVGGNLFVGARLTKASIEQISIAVLPFMPGLHGRHAVPGRLARSDAVPAQPGLRTVALK